MRDVRSEQTCEWREKNIVGGRANDPVLTASLPAHLHHRALGFIPPIANPAPTDARNPAASSTYTYFPLLIRYRVMTDAHIHRPHCFPNHIPCLLPTANPISLDAYIHAAFLTIPHAYYPMPSTLMLIQYREMRKSMPLPSQFPMSANLLLDVHIHTAWPF